MKRKQNGQFEKGQHWRQPQQFREKAWLFENYSNQNRSTGDIAKQFGVTDAAVLFWLRRHGIQRRTVSEARKIKHWGSCGVDNPMWNKRGELNPRWIGGVTPDRQSFYTSNDWKKACLFVWKRDKATCRRCGMYKDDSPDMPFHIHHVISFAYQTLRADASNLVLLCEPCHHFVHSRRNVSREYIQRIRNSDQS
jgi:hypothetical protein